MFELLFISLEVQEYCLIFGSDIQTNSDKNYSICIIDGVNFYSETILKELDDIDILFDNNENILYINQNNTQ